MGAARGPREPSRRAFVLVYAVGTLVLVSSLALSLVESTASDIEVAKARMHLVLARTAAESGIEYAMAFATRQLGRQYDVGATGGPWTDPVYFFERLPGQMQNPWFYSARAAGRDPTANALYGWSSTTPIRGYTSLDSQAEGPPFRLHQMNAAGARIADGARGTAMDPLYQVTQYQVSMTPEMTYRNVRIAAQNGLPTLFTVRSRGEVLFNNGTNPGGDPTVLASVFVVQTFCVAERDSSCDSPRPIRQVFDREPLTLTPGPNGATGTASERLAATGPTGNAYNQQLRTPNPH